MRRRWLRASLPGVLAGFMVGSLAVGACTRSGSQDAAQVVADPALQQLLQHVPADTPYAMISMGGGGMRDFIAKIYAPLEPMMKQLEGSFAGLDVQRELGLTDQHYALFKAVADECKGKLSVDGLASLGLNVDARFAIYGIGMLPAMRMQLRDPAALRGTLERIQTRAGARFPVGKVGNVEYWQITGGGYEGAVAIVGDQLVAGLAPAAQRDQVFALLFGTERPADHLGGSERFQSLLSRARPREGQRRLHRRPHASPRPSSARATRSTATPSPRWRRASPRSGRSIDDTCKQEIRSIVALAPRLVIGTEQIDGTASPASSCSSCAPMSPRS